MPSLRDCAMSRVLRRRNAWLNSRLPEWQGRRSWVWGVGFSKRMNQTNQPNSKPKRADQTNQANKPTITCRPSKQTKTNKQNTPGRRGMMRCCLFDSSGNLSIRATWKAKNSSCVRLHTVTCPLRHRTSTTKQYALRRGSFSMSTMVAATTSR